MTREPLTSTVTSRASSGFERGARRFDVGERGGRPRRTPRPLRSRARRSRTSRSQRPRAYSPISWCSAGAVGPSSAMLPNTRMRLPLKRREMVERGAHGAGVRVVAVVDDRRAVAARHGVQPAAHRRCAREPRDDVLGAGADGLRRGRRRERVRDVLPAEQRQLDVGFLAVGQAASRNSEPAGMKLRLAEHAAIGARRETERDRELAARARDPIARETDRPR